MGFVTQGVPKELVLRLASKPAQMSFVETGTYYGTTASWAAQHFRKIITIEVDPEISRETAKRLQTTPNIEFLVGNSGALLPQVIEKLGEPALFWLDGHYSGPGTGGEGFECPLMDELAALTKAKDPIILIDDARCFLGPPPPPHKPEQWPRIDEIFAYLAKNFPHHVTTVCDDVIISVPAHVKPALDQEWLDHFEARFPTPPPPPPPTVLDRIKRRLTRGRA